MRESWFIILHLLFVFTARTQELSYREYNTSHGMAQNQIVAWMQDRDGYMWFGHKAGVSRFDGVSFESFGEKDGLPDIFISTITQGPDGKIYVLTRKGFAVFDGKEFTPYPYKEDQLFFKWMANEFITQHLMEDWVYTNGSGESLLFKNGVYYPIDTLYPGLTDVDILTIWFSEDKKSFCYRDKDGLWVYERGNISLIDKNVKEFGSFFNTQNQTIGFQTANKVYLFDKKTLQLDSVFAFSWYKDGTVNYIDEFYNIYTIEAYSRLTIISKTSEKQSHEFKVPYINGIFKDREGNLWITGETGCLMLQSEAFRNYTQLHGSPDYVWTIVEDDKGYIWLASFGEGLYRYDGKEFRKIDVPNIPDGPGKEVFYKGAIKDNKGHLWFPHTNGVVKVENGLARFQKKIPQITTLYAYQDPYSQDIYFAQVDQVAILRADGRVDVLEIKPGNKPGLILSMVTDTLKRLWIGGPYGISILDQNKLIHLPYDAITFSLGAVSMVSDQRGNIWIGSRSGLYLYDYKGIKKILDRNNFLDKYVSDLKVVGSDGLYVGMIGGMAWLDLELFYNEGLTEVDFFDHSNGFLGREVLQNGSIVASDGTVWISATDRVVQFDPSKRKDRNRSNPNILIRSVSVLNDSMEWEELGINKLNAGSLILNHNQQHIRFDFAGITMVSPENTRYRFKLQGLLDEWSVPSKERYAAFTYLPPGKYSFMVDVSNNELIWNEAPAVIHFIIRNAWWQTAGFWILSGLVSILAVIGVVFLIFFSIRQKRIKDLITLKQIAELRLEAIKAQVDPHFVFNVLSSIGSSIYNNRKEEAYTLLTRFSKLIRKAFETNEKPYGDLSTEIEFTENYLELQKRRFKDAFEYKISIDPDIPGNARLPRLLLQTLTENAIKHGILPAGSERIIEIMVKRMDDCYQITVEDNGVGRQHSNNGENGSTGRGLQIARQLFDIFNQFNNRKITFEIIDKYNDDKTGAGTMVVVSIPFDFQFEIPDIGT